MLLLVRSVILLAMRAPKGRDPHRCHWHLQRGRRSVQVESAAAYIGVHVLWRLNISSGSLDVEKLGVVGGGARRRSSASVRARAPRPGSADRGGPRNGRVRPVLLVRGPLAARL